MMRDTVNIELEDMHNNDINEEFRKAGKYDVHSNNEVMYQNIKG